VTAGLQLALERQPVNGAGQALIAILILIALAALLRGGKH
jgi:hypothetical protein